jgi:hypothetical protein
VTPSQVTSWSRVTCIEASHYDWNTAYASVDRHQLQDFDPYIYRTRDMGKTWQKITTGLPAGVYVHAVKEDPMRRGLLVAGTERGVFISFDDGERWQSLQLNLPPTSMRDCEFFGNDLILATHGRGFWVIDDVAPLRQVNDALLKADAYLFKPSDTTLYEQGGDNGTPYQKDEPQAPNPGSGVMIDYFLRTDAQGPVTLEVLDAGGGVRATFSTTAPVGGGGGRGGRGGGGGIPTTTADWRRAPEPFSVSAGMHRVNWNPIGGGGRGRGAAAPSVVLPATFTARLTVNGQAQSQTFLVRPDPR